MSPGLHPPSQMNDSTSKRLHAVVEGRVQGVGFRNFVVVEALKLGLTGWVRNIYDGSVEVTAEGPRQTLDQFLQTLLMGPRHANVTDVRQDWQDASGEFTSFRVKYKG